VAARNAPRILKKVSVTIRDSHFKYFSQKAGRKFKISKKPSAFAGGFLP
jgi:hypothetical protein